MAFRRARLAGALMLATCGTAVASTDVGFASLVQRNAFAELLHERRQLEVGSRVRLNETLATDPFGRISVQFFDRTLLSVGPASRLKVDRFVVNPDGTAKSIIFNATKGAFRFATGLSESRAYRIETPVATMAVRGTRFAFEIDGQAVRVTVAAGAVQVCPRGRASSDCRMARPGQDVQVANQRATVGPISRSVAALAPLLGAPLSPAQVRDALQTAPSAQPLRRLQQNDPMPSSGSPLPLPSPLPSPLQRPDVPAIPGPSAPQPGGLLRR